jgi:Saxitoxin biosynthesis operon protein SxtJ
MASPASMHENLRREETVKLGSDRSFGIVFAVFCALVALLHGWLGKGTFWGWLGAAALFAGFSLFYSRALRPLNVLWFKFGLLLHQVVSPVILGVLFFAVFVPIGWCMRLAGKRPLSLEYDAAARSYWIARTPPAPPPGSFDRQF